jgi:hypothetical protein
VHEDHVDVADVVELAGTALAHRDHRQPAARGLLRQAGTGHVERGPECRVGEIRQVGGDLREAVPGEVAGSDRQQPAPVRHPQRVDRVIAPGARLVEQVGAGRLEERPRPQVGPVRGVGTQVVGQGATDTAHGGQPRPQRWVVGHRAQQLRRVRGDLDQPGHTGQRRVRIGSSSNCLDQGVDVG